MANKKSSADVQALLLVVKDLMRKKGVIYRDLMPVLQLSEASIKRLFSRQSFDIHQLAQICTVLGANFLEAAEIARRSFTPTHEYTREQDELLGKKITITNYVFIRLLMSYTPREIAKELNLDEKKIFKILQTMDKARLIDLYPGNRVALRVRGPFKYRPGGYMEKTYHTASLGLIDYFQDKMRDPKKFSGLFHSREFYLTKDTIEKFKAELLEISLRYRQLTSWQVMQYKSSELFPVNILLCLDEVNFWKQLALAGGEHSY